MSYGMPYMGSKSQIAEALVEVLPHGKRFVDLFGGGGAMSHCAALSGKYESVLYNELNSVVADTFRRAINGEYAEGVFTPRWISREEFHAKKDVDGYVRLCWSFGTNGQTYMFNPQTEKIKQRGHGYCVFGEDIKGVPNCDASAPAERCRFLANYCKAEFARIMAGDPTAAARYEYYCGIVYRTSKEFRDLSRAWALNFTAWLRATGITAREIKELTNSDMASHYLSRGSQPAVPTVEMFERLCASDKVKKENLPHELRELVYHGEFFIETEKRKHTLEQLEQLQQLERLEVSSTDYRDYEPREGDVVYCDPPYEGTADYGESFDHSAFYDWVASREFPVWFSSYEISDDRFAVVYQRQKRSLLNSARSYLQKTERLYANAAAQMILM